MTELDAALYSDWNDQQQRGDLLTRYNRYTDLVARNALKGIGPGEPLKFSEWIKAEGLKP